MKKLLLITLMLFSSFAIFSQQKNWAVGGKIGDPIGLNIRHYLSNDKNLVEVTKD